MSNELPIHSLIVGGSRGLGRALAQTFLEKGHKVDVISRASPGDADKAIRHIKADVGNSHELSKVLDGIAADTAPLDNLVFVQRHRGEGEAWAGEIEASLTATKTIIERLVGKFTAKGSIVIVTSVADRFIAEEQPVGYHAAKAALDHMARYYAVTLGPRGIRCNCVSPSIFIKEESREFHHTGDRPLFYKKVIPLGRAAEAAEICSVIAFLCSDEAAYVTGQNIAVDGGLSAQAHLTLASKVFPRSS